MQRLCEDNKEERDETKKLNQEAGFQERRGKKTISETKRQKSVNGTMNHSL